MNFVRKKILSEEKLFLLRSKNMLADSNTVTNQTPQLSNIIKYLILTP